METSLETLKAELKDLCGITRDLIVEVNKIKMSLQPCPHLVLKKEIKYVGGSTIHGMERFIVRECDKCHALLQFPMEG